MSTVTGNDGLRRVVAAVLAAALIVAGCAGAGATSSPGPSLDIVVQTPRPADVGNGGPNAEPTMPSWFSVRMTDVNTGKAFTIHDFAGKVVLVDTMATWCPTCQGEMSQIQDLLRTLGIGTDLVAVSLDVDPNEDATLLKKFATQNGFGWRVAIAPAEVGQFLAKNYDVDYLNPPLQPMLFIDRQGGVYGLPFGTKSASSLQQTLEPYLTQ
jgi:cytochrome oxidase Cu insertion factor (SCO1/SenC/PrrC family)